MSFDDGQWVNEPWAEDKEEYEAAMLEIEKQNPNTDSDGWLERAKHQLCHLDEYNEPIMTTAIEKLEAVRDFLRGERNGYLDGFNTRGQFLKTIQESFLSSAAQLGIATEPADALHEALPKMLAEIVNSFSRHLELCPVTRRPFFMTLIHPDLGLVPTYGGPFDSYTIPIWNQEDKEFRSERYDHDAGQWVEGGEPYTFVLVDEERLLKLQEDSAELECAKIIAKTCGWEGADLPGALEGVRDHRL